MQVLLNISGIQYATIIPGHLTARFCKFTSYGSIFGFNLVCFLSYKIAI